MEKSEITNLIIGVLLFIMGALIRYAVNRRRFNRRGVAGLQCFKSYEHATLITFIEKTGMLLAIIMLVVGLFFLVLALYNSTR